MTVSATEGGAGLAGATSSVRAGPQPTGARPDPRRPAPRSARRARAATLTAARRSRNPPRSSCGV
ncbi:MAG: hypothetical protein DMF77_02130 [Acidobacteria bacterium]|nr:MAG: hypothetical protein DMF77_02130 [Acidobacteriota bacterium]